MNGTQQQGFSLLELMVTLLVVGIVLGFGVPNFMEFQRNAAVTAAANDLVSAIYLARTEAVKRQVPVTLCARAALGRTPDSSSSSTISIPQSLRGPTVMP
jgi:type IV fimbrial biogenesis protein FimT